MLYEAVCRMFDPRQSSPLLHSQSFHRGNRRRATGGNHGRKCRDRRKSAFAWPWALIAPTWCEWCLPERCATVYAVTPYNPTAASKSATIPNRPARLAGIGKPKTLPGINTDDTDPDRLGAAEVAVIGEQGPQAERACSGSGGRAISASKRPSAWQGCPAW